MFVCRSTVTQATTSRVTAFPARRPENGLSILKRAAQSAQSNAMKFLEFNDMVALLPAEPKTVERAEEKLGVIFQRVKGDSQRLRVLTDSGVLSTFQVNHCGRPVAVVWYRTENERLIVDTLCAIVNDETTLPVACEAMKRVAIASNCKQIEGTTARAGLAEALIEMHWYPVGITIRKDI